MPPITITAAHLARHTPTGAGSQGRDAALVDIAQDLLLRDLHGAGLLDTLVFKGGTALRKLYAGTQGRFSLDLDFSVRELTDSPEHVLAALALRVEGLRIGPFEYALGQRRGKRLLHITSPTLQPDGTRLTSKLDVSPPPWLPPTTRGWIPLPVHATYGHPPLPRLPVIRLEENLAEKIARLNRATPARDMYDLRWTLTNHTRTGGIDLPLARHLAVLKIWVDAHGVTAAATNTRWKPGHEAHPFNPDHWLRVRRKDEFDAEDIGALAIPPPTLTDLATDIAHGYAFLRDLDGDERAIANCRGQDRPLVLRMLQHLPGQRLHNVGLY